MKKTLIITGLAVAVVFLAGCWNKEKTGSVPIESSTINSMKDAIGLGKKMVCIYKDDTYGIETKMYVEGDKYRSENTQGGDKRISISTGEVIYDWSENTKKGMKYETDCIKEANQGIPEREMIDVEETMKLKAEDYAQDNDVKTNCKPVSSIDFSIPSDVVFEDYCEVLKNQMKAMEQMQQNMPTIPTGPAGM